MTDKIELPRVPGFNDCYTINYIITNPNLIEFKEQVEQFRSKIPDSEIYAESYSTTVLSVKQGGVQGFMTIPSWYIEWFVTKEAHKSWKFTQKIMT